MIPDKQSGQAILCDAIRKLEKLFEKGMHTDIIWIPGHMSIAGNDKVDKEAKKAAKSMENGVKTTTFLPLESARSQSIKCANKEDWKNEWKEKATSAHLRKITTRRHINESAKIYNTTRNRRDAAWLVRLRTGHCPLNEYLYRFEIAESPTCKCNSEIIETVDHYLTRCSRYERERQMLIRKVGVGGMWVDELLGDAAKVNYTLDFIRSTGRFTF